ncbi:MAG TPA: macro domain-containing protein [Nitrososphaeraceae archaeon]|jgi:O-acetyl-ADP-ribose deacetylase (regulator of RNase III)|nr:macro domain-containing protein [Nitrososphaeraceae archaeon]
MGAVVVDQIVLRPNHIEKRIIKLVKGDITERETDAIVNAANSYLKHGGGVAGAIVRRGGKIIQEKSDEIGFVPVGSAAITVAGKLPCKAVIHVVGPRMGEGDEDTKLRKAVNAGLKLASERKFKSISIPAISSGIFGFPKDKCAEILIEETSKFLMDDTTTLNVIEFCVIDEETVGHFKVELAALKNLTKI